MAFDDRLQYLLLGMAIGFVLGYLVRLVRDIKEELDEVDDVVKKLGNEDHERNQDGFVKVSWIANVALLLVVGLTAWASVVSQKASNDVKIAQESQKQAVYCANDVLGDALTVLNARSSYSNATAHSNVKLQKDFAKFFNLLLHQPPFSSKEQLKAAKDYQASLNNFVKISGQQKDTSSKQPYPSAKELDVCLAQRNQGE